MNVLKESLVDANSTIVPLAAASGEAVTAGLFAGGASGASATGGWLTLASGVF